MDNSLQRALGSMSPRGRSIHRLLNPEDFLQLASDEVSRALRYDRPLSVALISMDGLAENRKLHGRSAVQEITRAATEATLAMLRRLDRVGRLGPGDLGILMPETGMNNAAAVMERLRRTTEKNAISTAAGDMHVTFSIGVAGITPRLRDPKAFLMRACYELRRAQNDGRNTVCVAAADKVKMTVPRSAQIH